MLRRFWDDLADPVRRLEDLMPSTEIYTENGDLIVRFELAGVDPQKDVTVMVDNHELVIRGERGRPNTAPSSGASRYWKASTTNRFRRSTRTASWKSP